MTDGPYTTITVKEYTRLKAVVVAAEDLTSANGFVEGTHTYSSLPGWLIARVRNIATALADLRK